VSTGEGTADQAHDEDRHTSSSPAAATSGTGATKRRGLLDQEHRLVEQGRELLDEGRELLHEEERKLLDEEHRLSGRVKTSAPGILWSRLNAIDFMTSSMQFAALAVLCLFPFLIVVAAETGSDVRPDLIRRLGLDRNAAKAVDTLMSPGTHAVAGLGVLGVAFVLLGAIGVASTLQAWYHRVYDLTPRSKWARQLAAQLLWLAGSVIYFALYDSVVRMLGPVGGARVPIYAGTCAVAIPFYWWTQHVLLLGKVRWSQLFPGALATGLCVTGLAVFSSFVFSGEIVSSDRDYGPIGVVMVLLSYLVGFAVCLHLGAMAGRVWNERHPAKSPGKDRPLTAP
jgi:membrane protein